MLESEPSNVNTERHCTFPDCLTVETENYSIKVGDIPDESHISYIKTLTDDSGLYFANDSYICKSHIQLTKLVKEGGESMIISEEAASRIVNRLNSTDDGNERKLCALCSKSSSIHYTRVSLMKNIKFRNFLTKKHKNEKVNIKPNDLICELCVKIARNRFNGMYCTPLKDIKKSCDVETCTLPAEGHKFTIETDDIFEGKLPYRYSPGRTKVQLCREHKRIYYRSSKLCIVCLKFIRKSGKKEVSEASNLSKSTISAIEEAIKTEDRTLPDDLSDYKIHRPCSRRPKLHLPSNKIISAKRSLESELKETNQKKKCTDSDSAFNPITSDMDMEEPAISEDHAGETFQIDLDKSTTSEDQAEQIIPLEENVTGSVLEEKEIRDQALENTLKELDKMFRTINVARMSQILKIYNQEVQNIAIETSYHKKLSNKTASWLEQQIKEKNPSLNLLSIMYPKHTAHW